MKAFLQDKQGNEIIDFEIPGPAPDIIQYKGQYFRKHFIRKMGDCLYRPATIYYY